MMRGCPHDCQLRIGDTINIYQKKIEFNIGMSFALNYIIKSFNIIL